MTILILIIFATSIIYLVFGIEQFFQHRRLWYGVLIGSFFLCLSYNLMIASAYFSGVMLRFPWAHQTHIPFYYALGPLCYLIFFYRDDGCKTFQKKHYLHFLVPFLVLVGMTFYYASPSSEKIKIISMNVNMSQHWSEYVEQFGGLVFVFYIGWIYHSYAKQRSWTKQAKIFYFVTASTALIEIMLIAIAFVIESSFLFLLALTFQLFYITVIYALARITPNYFTKLLGTNRQYEISSLNHIDNNTLICKLEELTNQKIYLHATLTVNELAQELNISVRQLSEFLHNNYKQNFRSYINHLRIDFAKDELLQKPEKKIIEIAYDCGFNSISVFNGAFKEYTGSTPRNYRKKKSQT